MTKKTGLGLVVVVIVIVAIVGFFFRSAEEKSEIEDTTSSILKLGIITSSEQGAGPIKEALTELGYLEGENLQYHIEAVTETNQYEPAIQTLISDDVNAIVTIGTPVTIAASQLTSSVPIIFILNQDQFVRNIKPLIDEQGDKTNLTGVITSDPIEKRFELLMEIMPDTKVIYYVYDPSNELSSDSLGLLETAATERGVSIESYTYSNFSEAQTALETIPEDVDAIILPTENATLGLISEWMGAATERKIPLVVALGLYNTDSATFPAVLLGYGGSVSELYNQLYDLIDQVLKGTAPADLPVRPSDIYLTVSLGAADMLGIELPDDILDQANYVLREAVEIPTAEADAEPAEVSGDMACNATLVSPLGENSVCLTRSCSQVEDNAMLTYTDKTDVPNCSTENVIGICSRDTGDSYYYSGDVAALESGCAAFGGEWKTSLN